MTCRNLQAIIYASLLLLTASFACAAKPDTTVRLPGHILPALARAKPVARESSSRVEQPLTLTLVLKRDDQAGFERYLHEVYDASSPNYRKFLTQSELSDRFGPSRGTYDKVLSHLQRNGFTLVEGSENRLTLMVRGNRSEVEKAFALHIRNYKIGDKRFYANDRDPELPAHLASAVQTVSGLSNLAQPRANDIAHDIGVLVCKFSNALASANNEPEKVKDCGNYQFFWYSSPAGKDPPGWEELDGTGQTVGLIEFDTFQMSDVADFLSLIGAPATKINNVSEVKVNGGAPLGLNQAEVLLDINTVLTGAPGAKVVVYDGPFTGAGTSFQALFNAAINGGSTIISNSWAYCEDQTTLADVQSIDSIFKSAAAAGITILNGAGDSGSTCLDGAANTVAVPADSPNATAVGGSSLSSGHGYTYGSEQWWNGANNTPPTGQGGFGQSNFFAVPTYQAGLANSARRSIPDVVANADPASGVLLCQASAGGCPTGLIYGGTSIAAPVWAAFSAVLNQGLGQNIGALNQAIYPFANTSAFHNATSMGSDFAHVGLGSPNLNQLYLKLSGKTVGTPNATFSGLFPYIEVPFSSSSGIVAADGQAQQFVNVRLLDANSNPVGGKTVTLAANPGSNVKITPPSGITSVDNGVVVFTLTDLVPEIVTLTATDTTDGIVLQQQSRVAFSVPPATSAGISPPSLTVTANGVATATITVTLKDALNRPTPGKLITLSQGNGHSLITGPNPSVTDANGQIIFATADLVNEVVTYTAIDVTDGDLPIPGSTVVTFTNGSGGACGQNTPPPVGLNGYTVTPFATGFPTGQLFYSNVNYGNCSGVLGPAFLDDSAYIVDFFNGDVYKLGVGGGAASNANKLITIGLTLGWPVISKDEHLYATRAGTGGNFNTGIIVELDLNTGGIARTLATGLTCPQDLVVDPLSGDLFFDDVCFGGGSDNPSLFRIRNPGGATPTLEVYATLPSTPNGQIIFSPKGTIYAVTGYTQQSPPVVRVSGTNVLGTPTVTTLPGVASNYWLNIGAVDASGEATTLITLQNGNLQLTDITTNPPTITATMTSGVGGGIIGPDGCLYMPNQNALYKLTDPTGGCSFLPTNAAPSITLTPTTVSPNPAQGTSQTFTATIRNTNVLADTPMFFSVTGANAQVKLVHTDATGQAAFNYIATSSGQDTIVATTTLNSTDLTSNKAKVTWVNGQHVTFLTLNPSPKAGAPGQAVTVIASLTDSSVSPVDPIIGATVNFTLGSGHCIGTTDNNGLASCTLFLPTVGGMNTLTATFAGTAQFVASSDATGFNVVAPPVCIPSPEVCDGIDNNCNGQIDEGLGTLSCGVGVCARTVDACVNGVTQICTPGTPSPEVCDGKDNNCNGQIDEGLGTLSCGVGACARTVNACVNGVTQICTPGTPSPEVWDGIDNNCNGQVDEGLICTPPVKCPHGANYWKNHPTSWAVMSLKLGSQTYTQTELLKLLGSATNSDASVLLARQLIAAKLNIVAGVDSKPIATTVASADQQLSAFHGKLPYHVTFSSTAGKALIKAADKLGDFNEGELTPQCKKHGEDD